jgi:hypothetical protein
MVDEMEQAEHFWRRRSTSILHRHEPGLRDTWRWSISDEAELTRTWPVEDESSSTPTLDTKPTERAGPIPTVGDDVGGVVYDPVELEQTDVDHTDDYEIKPADSVIDPLRFAGRQPESNGNGSEADLTRWLWVEAAAAAWLAQREDAGIDSSGSYAPPSSNDGDAKAF